MELGGKRVMVVGLGVSGLAAARLLHERGAALVLTDKRRELGCESVLPPAELHLGGEDPAWLKDVELVVTSPGVPPSSALLSAALASGIRVIGELELAGRFIAAPLVAITGTNGKSTVTVLAAQMLTAAGRKIFVGGNLGRPLSEAVGGTYDAAVVEVSSFQLERIERLRPKVAVHLNLTEDHLDRYRDLEEYGRAKARLFENQEPSDWALLNLGDPTVWKLSTQIGARVVAFGVEVAGGSPAIWATPSSIEFDLPARRGHVGLERFALSGRHNRTNAMAAAGAALLMGAETAAVEDALASFKGLAHRISVVRQAGAVTWIDDSKGTNVGAVMEALAAVRPPIVLIAGGTDKGGDYAPLRRPLEKKVRLLILMGAAREKMRAALEGATVTEVVETLADAVNVAASAARPGDTVLLSPACASFDQFKDYAERGRIFAELVRSL